MRILLRFYLCLCTVYMYIDLVRCMFTMYVSGDGGSQLAQFKCLQLYLMSCLYF